MYVCIPSEEDVYICMVCILCVNGSICMIVCKEIIHLCMHCMWVENIYKYYACMYTYLCMYVYLLMYVCMYVCMYVSVCYVSKTLNVCMYICMYV